MECPKCQGDTSVKETRGVVRRRLCKRCGLRFYTAEVLASAIEAENQARAALAEVRKASVERVAVARRARVPDEPKKAAVRLAARREIEDRRYLRELDAGPNPDDDYLPTRY